MDVLVVAAAACGYPKAGQPRGGGYPGRSRIVFDVAGSAIQDQRVGRSTIHGSRRRLDAFAERAGVPEELLTIDNVVVLLHQGSGHLRWTAMEEEQHCETFDSFLTSGWLVTPVR